MTKFQNLGKSPIFGLFWAFSPNLEFSHMWGFYWETNNDVVFLLITKFFKIMEKPHFWDIFTLFGVVFAHFGHFFQI